MIGVFGGTFDPIHTGHLILCRDAIEKANLEGVILVPAYVSPFKEGMKITSPEHRLEMVRLAVKEDTLLSVSDFEVKKEGISYTIDTLKFLKAMYGDVAMIIGADQARDFKKWYQWEDILRMVKIYVLRRKGVEFQVLEGMIPLDTRLIEISSTEIRERVKQGKSIRYLVPEPVERYILEKKLYT